MMTWQLTANPEYPPIAYLAVADFLKDKISINIDWADNVGKTYRLKYPNGQHFECYTESDLLRSLVRSVPSCTLYGRTVMEQTQVDHWLCLSNGLNTLQDLLENIENLNNAISSVTFLVLNEITIADFALFHRLYKLCHDDLMNQNQRKLCCFKSLPHHVQRWYKLIYTQSCLQNVLKSLPEKVENRICNKNSYKESMSTIAHKNIIGDRKQEGKFEILPGAEIGKVVVRFPPEASGYLHIGHAKAALLNQYYAQTFQGKLIMRFDDTNPAKENAEFEKEILADLELLEIKPDVFSHSSNYFKLMMEYCEQLIKEGKAYVDNTCAEQMKIEREQKIESKHRNNDVSTNLKMWQEMCNGTTFGQTCCVRAKIDMNSMNGCMRDPTIYRCKNEPHPRTGTQYKVYPTYDFACPIVDATEKVTHTLRTMEYHDRDEQFYWFIDALNLPKPYIWEFSRLNMTNTVLSKRKLTWFVESNLVDGWDDPRFPTVRGIMRRGMTVQGLKEFIIAQGSSKAVVFMNWDKIWAFNKKVIDRIAPRYTALDYKDRIIVYVSNVTQNRIEVPIHPKNDTLGKKFVTLGPKIYIDYVDAETLKEKENATFINWGNLMIDQIQRNITTGRIEKILATPNLDDKNFKKTVKLTWLAVEENEETYPPTYCVYFDHIISKPILAKDENFKQYVGHKTREEIRMLGDPELKNCQKGDIIQLQRRGFFRVDQSYSPASPFSGAISPVILFSIPDGHTKDFRLSGSATNNIETTTTNIKGDNNTKLNENADENSDLKDINNKIICQGDKIRQLKALKAAKTEIDVEVKSLLLLKSEYKSICGQEWKPLSIRKSNLLVTEDDLILSENQDKELSSENEILIAITAQEEKIRQMQADKAESTIIDFEVKQLLTLKAKYKECSGIDWKPGTHSFKASSQGSVITVKVKQEINPDRPNSKIVCTLLDKINTQGNKIRQMKSNKVEKAEIDYEVKVLLALKADYKNLTGQDWKPDVMVNIGLTSKTSESISAPLSINTLSEKICQQGEKIRKLKSEGTPKASLDPEIQNLLLLKSQYKLLNGGKEWTSDNNRISALSEKDLLTKEINEQGDRVRAAKSNKIPKKDLDIEIAKLLALKAKYKEVTGTDFLSNNANRQSFGGSSKKMNIDGKDLKTQKLPSTCKASLTVSPFDGNSRNSTVKKQTRLGLEARKEDNLPDWYSQVIIKGEFIEYYDVSGCYILRPWAFGIWRVIKNWLDDQITRMGVKECYFPLFVSRSALEKEKTHIADFAPEVAWVTKSGDSELAEPIAVRPTSETVMYPTFAKWIQSYRDLPIRLNQWNNVVRWEFKHPQPFLRTREFLWQEGHTAFASKADAEKEVLDILDLYAKVYTDLLAIPVVKGRKTEKEKFAGGDYTTTVEAFISASGRAIQGATSHHLGQNFSKMFEIIYEDPQSQQKEYVYQNSWGLTTRTIGVMIMVHADNQGIVLPPHVASIQAIIVPCGITVQTTDIEKKALLEACQHLERHLTNSAGIRCEGDYRDNYSPGWKFNHWELKGVPVRIEVGPKDIKAEQIVAVRRDTGEKLILAMESVETKLKQLLETIHDSMLAKAKMDLANHTKKTKNWMEFCQLLDQKNLLLAPFCGRIACEEKIKTDSARGEDAEPGAPAMGAKSLCIPFEQPSDIIPSVDKCIHPGCTSKPIYYTLFGRSY